MLPKELREPGQTFLFEPSDAILAENMQRFPGLDPNFILQICFEHPDRFDKLFPYFDPYAHNAVRTLAGWVYDYVRYDEGKEPDFWSKQFDNYLRDGECTHPVFIYMLQNGTWPFPQSSLTPASRSNSELPASLGNLTI